MTGTAAGHLPGASAPPVRVMLPIWPVLLARGAGRAPRVIQDGGGACSQIARCTGEASVTDRREEREALLARRAGADRCAARAGRARMKPILRRVSMAKETQGRGITDQTRHRHRGAGCGVGRTTNASFTSSPRRPARDTRDRKTFRPHELTVRKRPQAWLPCHLTGLMAGLELARHHRRGVAEASATKVVGAPPCVHHWCGAGFAAAIHPAAPPTAAPPWAMSLKHGPLHHTGITMREERRVHAPTRRKVIPAAGLR